MSEAVPVLTIDGPSGSGKGTITRLVAEQLGWHVLDSGALYRVLALFAINSLCALDNQEQLAQLAQRLPVVFKNNQVYLADSDVTNSIRDEEVSLAASRIAVFAPVRQALLERQRAFVTPPGLVADGRDMGTIVFPQAFLKVYLDASVAERAKRRFLQLKGAGYDVKLDDLATDIMQRDERDKTRAVAPLKPAVGALILDTSAMSIAEVFKTIMAAAQQRLSS